MNIVTINKGELETVNEAVCKWAINSLHGPVKVNRLTVIKCISLPPDDSYGKWVNEQRLFDKIPKNEEILVLVCYFDAMAGKIKLICWLHWMLLNEDWVKKIVAIGLKIDQRFYIQDAQPYFNKCSGTYNTYPHFNDFKDFAKMMLRMPITQCVHCSNGITVFCQHCFDCFYAIITKGVHELADTRRVDGYLVVSTIRSLVLCYLQSKPDIALETADRWRDGLTDPAIRQYKTHREYMMKVPLSLGRAILDYQDAMSTFGIIIDKDIFTVAWVRAASTIFNGMYVGTKIYDSLFPWEIKMSAESTAFAETRNFLCSYKQLREITGESLGRAIIIFADQLIASCNIVEKKFVPVKCQTIMFTPDPKTTVENFDIEELYFPPCMQNLLKDHRTTHQFRNEHRFPLTSFLCNIHPININEHIIAYWEKIAPPRYHKDLTNSFHFKIQSENSGKKEMKYGRKLPMNCDNNFNVAWCPFKGANRKEQCANHFKQVAKLPSNVQVNIVNPPSYYRQLKKLASENNNNV